MSKNTIFISLEQIGQNVLTFSVRTNAELITILKLQRLTKMKIQLIKFFIIFFSLGWSVYMGGFLIEAFQEIHTKNLQTLQQLKNENQKARSI